MERTESIMLLDRKQVAILLGVSGSTIRRWYLAGQMPEPVIKMHRKRYWSAESIKELRQKMSQNRSE
jgi:predicted site-specific integrase-resolvase